MQKYEELRIWKESRVFVCEIYKMLQKNKNFSFRDQLQRAALSIMNNIAEGFDAGSDKLFIRYLHCAKASCGEVNSMLYLCEDLNYADKEKVIFLHKNVYSLSAGIYNLIKYLNDSRDSGHGTRDKKIN